MTTRVFLALVVFVVVLSLFAAILITQRDDAGTPATTPSSWRIVRTDGVEMVVDGMDCRVSDNTASIRLYCWPHGLMSTGAARRIIQVIDIEEIKPNE